MKMSSFIFLSLQETVKSSAPNDLSISAKRFFILSRMIFGSAPNEMKLAERCLKHLSACNVNIMSDLICILKDEGSFCKTLV